MVFNLRVMCQVAIGAEAQMCQNIVFLYVFQLSSVSGLCKNVEILRFLDVDQSKTL